MSPKHLLLCAALVLSSVNFMGCGSGGSDDVDLSGGGEGQLSGAKSWLVTANVEHDSCGERISAVRQKFDVQTSSDSVVVDTDVVIVHGTKTGDGFTFGFSEQNGDCVRTYSGTFSSVSGNSASVRLVANSACATQTCESSWVGTANGL